MNMCGIHKTDGKFVDFSLSMTSFGFFGDVLKRSEKMRTIKGLGFARYDIAGVKSFMKLKPFCARVSYLPSQQPEFDVKQDNNRKIKNKGESFDEQSIKSNNEWEHIHPQEYMVLTATPMKCACSKLKQGISPTAQLNDGTTDLILVKRCNKMQFFRYLLANKSNSGNFDFPFVEVKRVKAVGFQLRPAEDGKSRQSKSCWNMDGEVMCEYDVIMRMHRGLVDFFSRGV